MSWGCQSCSLPLGSLRLLRRDPGTLGTHRDGRWLLLSCRTRCFLISWTGMLPGSTVGVVL